MYQYDILKIDLDTATTDKLYELHGGYLYVIDAYDTNTKVTCKFNDINNDAVDLVKYKTVIAKFDKLYLSWSAQAGKWIKLLVSTSDELFRIIENIFSGDVRITGQANNLNVVIQGDVRLSQYISIYNLTLTNANTEYSQHLPYLTKKFTIKARNGDIKVAFTAGQSGTTYISISNGQSWSEDHLWLANIYIYMQSPTAGTVVEIIAWT